eukprot:CAMPEP_0202496516 /NCGR_PEP_ID=MMETSP1361-20130828/20118_1 /ASSEMBLY_ACC=CAM_ASM_000849 /TAXON_ID=210615 /ORGANISM="Staurosira complex sp., Strain CCMP2646" /LENGTH=171 /DNA_ID=CAMNT_0049127871 /DNA_START=94 /DNA_END=606 /DNA_ORIENTATION=+
MWKVAVAAPDDENNNGLGLPAEASKARIQVKKKAWKTRGQTKKNRAGGAGGVTTFEIASHAAHSVPPARDNDDSSVDATSRTKKRVRSDQAATTRPQKRSKHMHKTWDERYADLLAFKKKYGHARVPSNKEYVGLANWLYVQKNRNKPGPYRCSKLTNEQVAKLNRLGVDW